jgi:hypothetical protein
MLSAVAAFTLPATDDLLDASLVNTATLLGALCSSGAPASSCPRSEYSSSVEGGAHLRRLPVLLLCDPCHDQRGRGEHWPA